MYSNNFRMEHMDQNTPSIVQFDPLDNENEFSLDSSFDNTTEFRSITKNESQITFTFGTTNESTENKENSTCFSNQILRHQSIENEDEYHTYGYWKNLYLEELKKNEKMIFEKDAFMLMIKSYSQTISTEEYEMLTQIPENLKEVYDKLMKKQEEIRIDGIESN